MPDEYDAMMSAYHDCEEQRLKCLRAVSKYDQAGAGYAELLEMYNSGLFWDGFRMGIYFGTAVTAAITLMLICTGVI